MLSHRNLRSNQNSNPFAGSLLEPKLTELGAGGEEKALGQCFGTSLGKIKCLCEEHQDRLKMNCFPGEEQRMS